jgi:hypothetical protein
MVIFEEERRRSQNRERYQVKMRTKNVSSFCMAKRRGSANKAGHLLNTACRLAREPIVTI